MNTNISNQISALNPYERTLLLKEFLRDYEIDGSIYCCFKCHALGGEVSGRGMCPIDFFECRTCHREYCVNCEKAYIDEEYNDECQECRGKK